jgi:hypothetical protein
MVEFARNVEPAYTFEHYACVPDPSDRLCRNFGTKANRVTAELWVSLPRTTLLSTSHSLDIFEIMTGYIASICKISSDVSRDLAQGE